MTEKDEKKRALDLALAQIEKQYGKGAVMKLGTEDRPADVPAISSGSLGLDIALGRPAFVTEIIPETNTVVLGTEDDLNRSEMLVSQLNWMKYEGITEGMEAVTKIRYKDKVICYMADLLPSTGHIPLAYVMGYDTRPLITLDEKERFLNEAADNQYILFFQHDPVNECCTVVRTEKGVRLDRTFKLNEIL